MAIILISHRFNARFPLSRRGLHQPLSANEYRVKTLTRARRWLETWLMQNPDTVRPRNRRAGYKLP